MQKKNNLCFALIAPLILWNTISFADDMGRNISFGDNAPMCIGCKKQITSYRFGERVGKKIAIRQIYLIPTYNFTKKTCPEDNENCKDSHEVAFLYLTIQSLSPEPVLITAGRIDIRKAHSIELNAMMGGNNVLSDRITETVTPSQFLIKPGEIKRIALSQGITLRGVSEFFKEEILDVPIWDDMVPRRCSNNFVVKSFNRFIQGKFGKDASFKIQFYEKDYQPLLSAQIKLGDGSNMFSKNDEGKSKYQIQHDVFIAEAIYQFRGGDKPSDPTLSN